MRFRPEQHLRRQTDIRAVREHGRRFDGRSFTVWWKPRPQTEATPAGLARSPRDPGSAPRVCVIASTAAVGPAVQRNRAKRRLRDVFRRHQDRVPSHSDLLLIARSAVTTCPMLELESRFTDVCRQIERAAVGRSA
jgi:ribonuclease P protein component